jgi:hypothetical protein
MGDAVSEEDPGTHIRAPVGGTTQRLQTNIDVDGGGWATRWRVRVPVVVHRRKLAADRGDTA